MAVHLNSPSLTVKIHMADPNVHRYVSRYLRWPIVSGYFPHSGLNLRREINPANKQMCSRQRLVPRNHTHRRGCSGDASSSFLLACQEELAIPTNEC